MSQPKKGDRVRIVNNSIFNDMGLGVVTGEVFMVFPSGTAAALKCDQTGCMERFDFDDGEIEVL